jgi:hypothetical protein
MSGFSDLNSVYFHIEGHAEDYIFAREISDLFAALTNGSDTDSKAEKAQWEAEFFDVSFDMGEVERPEFGNGPPEKYEYLI